MECKCNLDKICKIVPIIIVLFIILLILLVIFFTNTKEPKSILTTFAENGYNTQVGTAIIKFNKNQIKEGNAINHDEGSDIISIRENGIYQISYQLFGKRQTLGTFNFNAILLINNNTLTNTINESPVLKDNVINRMTLTSTVILKLNSGDILQLGALSQEDIIYTDARIDIEKIK